MVLVSVSLTIFLKIVNGVWLVSTLKNWFLRSVYDSDTATTLTGLHFGTTTLLTTFLTWLGYIQPSQLPWPDLLKFVLFANFSIVGMNVSLMWNSVGFYQVGTFLISMRISFLLVFRRILTWLCWNLQIAKLSMIPVSCLLEVVLDNVRYSRDTKLSILLVLAGVAVCTVTDVSVNLNGFLAAAIAVWSTALQQYVSIWNLIYCRIWNRSWSNSSCYSDPDPHIHRF